MAETSDYEPSSYWSGHDFDSDRKSYDAHAGRSYDAAKSKGTTLKDLLPEKISTDSLNPFVAWMDGSGSMGGWPGVMCGKLPYMEHQLRTEYLGDDMAISWGLICDSRDTYPLEVRPFASKETTETEIKELVFAGGGSGDEDRHERYDVALLYLAKNVIVPKNSSPVAVFVGDEMPYEYLTQKMAKRFSIIMEQSQMSIEEIVREVTKKWNFYFIFANTGFYDGPYTAQAIKKWQSLIGDDHVAVLKEPERVVDVTFGLLAAARNKVAYFQEEIERRQTLEQVETVYTALKNVLPSGGLKRLPYTVLPNTGGTKSQPLLTKK